MDVHIRWMIRRDMEEVIEIENLSFECPLTEREFVACLRKRNCIGMVAEFDDQIAGFMIYELGKTSLNVLDFAVHPDVRRCGVATQMLNKIKSKLSKSAFNLSPGRQRNKRADATFSPQSRRALHRNARGE